MGQLLTQMPQAMHLPAVAPETAGETITWKGQTSAHVHSRLGILGNGAKLTCLGALATLDTGQRLRGSVLLHNLDTGLILMEFLVEGL